MIKIERKNGKPNCLYVEGGRRRSARQVADLEAEKGERERLWDMGEQLHKITQRMERGQLFGPRLLWHLQEMVDEMKGA